MPPDYSNQNLKLRSFKNQDLEGANFSNADIRGVRFNGANLSGADFSNARTGLPLIRKIVFFLFSMFLSLYSAIIFSESCFQISILLLAKKALFFSGGVFISCIVAVYMIIAVLWGFGRTFQKVFIKTILITIALGGILTVAGIGKGYGTMLAVSSMVIVAMSIFIGTFVRIASGYYSNIVFILIGCSCGFVNKDLRLGICTVPLALVCMIISQRALAGDIKHDYLRKTALKWVAGFGTNFRKANLDGADFKGAVVMQSDFTGASLKGTTIEGKYLNTCLFG